MTDGQELAVVEHAPAPLTVFGTDNPAAIVQRVTEIARPLADFIKQQGMSSNISGREYVLAEGWSFMGAMLGVSPRTVSVSELRDAEGRVCGFEANVELLTRDGSVVGGAVAECSRYEEMWSWEPHARDGRPLPARDDFALKSMAQTRATGKAYRMAFGFVMKAAGYEATPAEEMPALHGEVIDPPSAMERTQRAEAQTDPHRGRQPTPPQARDGGPGEIANAGQWLQWGLDTHGLSKKQMCEMCEVGSPSDIQDFAAAKRVIEQKLGVVSEPA